MTALFVKVTNQMVTACKLYVTDNGYKKFWELDHPVVLERMSACVRLNDEYQKCYHRTKVKVAASPDESKYTFIDWIQRWEEEWLYCSGGMGGVKGITLTPGGFYWRL